MCQGNDCVYVIWQQNLTSSTQPVRDALSELEAEGLVTSEPRRGRYCHPIESK